MASRRIEVEIIGSEKSLQAALGRSGASLTGFQAKANRLSTGLTRIGTSLTRNVTLPIVAVGAASAKMALDYDTAINHVQALTGASAKQTQQWSDEILKLAPRIGQTPQELANALYFVASSGAKVNQVLPITVASAKAAAAGMGDAQTVAQLLTSAMNAYGPRALSAAKATDILTAAVKVGKAEPAEFAQELGKVIPVAQNLGISFAQVAGLTANLTNTGLDAATATTGLRNAMLKILAPTAGATKEFKKIGLSVADVQNEVKTKGLLGTLQDLSKRVDGNRQAMHAMFPDARGLTAILALIGPNSKNAAAALDQVEHSTGAANKAFRTASSGPGQKLNRELADLEATAIKVGNDLLPVVLELGHNIASVADDFSHLSKNEQHAIEIGLGIAALVGPTARFGGSVATLAGWVSKLGGASKVAAGSEGVAGLGAAAETATGIGLAPFAGAAAGIVGLGLAYWFLGSHTAADKMTTSVDNLEAAVHDLPGDLHSLRDSAHDVRTAFQRMNAIVQKTPNDLHAITAAQDVYEGKLRAHEKIRQGYIHDLAQMRHGLTNLIRAGKPYAGLQVQGAEATAHMAQKIADWQGNAERAVGSLDGLVRKLEASHSPLAATARNEQAIADAALLVSKRINGIPTFKQIRIQMIQDIITNRYTGATSGPPTGGTSGDPHHRAAGGPVYTGTRYIVGDRGPELSEPTVPGRIIPNSQLGGRMRFVIDDWEKMTGYIEHVAGGVEHRAARRRGQLTRMGA